MKPLFVLIAITIAGTSAWSKDLAPLLAAMAPLQAIPDSRGRTIQDRVNKWQALADVPRMRWKWPLDSAPSNDGMVGQYALREDAEPDQDYTVKIEGNAVFLRRMKIEAWRPIPDPLGLTNQKNSHRANASPAIFGPAVVRPIATTCDLDDPDEAEKYFSLQRPGHVPVFVRFASSAFPNGVLYTWSISYTQREMLSDGGPDCDRK